MEFVQQKKGRWSILPCGFRRTRFLWGGHYLQQGDNKLPPFQRKFFEVRAFPSSQDTLNDQGEKPWGKTWKTQKNCMFHSKACFFSVVLHNLGKIRPNHWTLRGGDMPRMLCPARCRKVWIRFLNTFENNKCRWYLWLMTLGWNRSTHSMRYHQVYYVCVCASVSLKTVTYRHVVQPCTTWLLAPLSGIGCFYHPNRQQQISKPPKTLLSCFFGQYIYIYVCVCLCVCSHDDFIGSPFSHDVVPCFSSYVLMIFP